MMPRPEGAHAFIQWKGTDVCADAHCSCGARAHIDAEFFYFIHCEECGKVYEVGQYVPLLEVTDPERLHLAITDYAQFRMPDERS